MKGEASPQTESGASENPVRGRLRLNLRGVVYLLLTCAVGVAAVVKGNNLLFLVFCSLLGIFVASLSFTLLIPRRLRLERRIPETAFCGEIFTVSLRLRNSKRFFPVIAARLEDRILYEIRGLQNALSAVHIPLVRPGETERGRYTFPAQYRGWAKFGPVKITAEFPPGLVTYTATIPLENRTLIFPRPASIRGNVADPFPAQLPHYAVAPVPDARGQEEFAGLREFRPGDNPKHIHWKMSARLQERWVLREFEDTHIRNAVVYLESFLPNPADARRRRRLERAISFAIALVHRLCAERYRVAFRTFAPEILDIAIEPRTDDLGDLLYRLAQMRGTRNLSLDRLFAARPPGPDEVCFVLRIGEAEISPPFDPERTVELFPSDMRSTMVYEE